MASVPSAGVSAEVMSFPLADDSAMGKVHGLPFVLTAIITSLVLSLSSLHYGFARNGAQAGAVARMLVESIGAKGQGMPAENLRAMQRNFGDLLSVEACYEGRCQQLSRPPSVTPALQWLGDSASCASASSDSGPARTASVCLSAADVYQDLARDLSILLTAQLVCFLLWEASTRGHRRRAVQWREEVTRAATTDPLTGLFNRSAFTAALQVACVRTDACGWLLFIDLNGFKQINDQYGHAAGDHVIEVIGSRLAASFEGFASVARLGGDEFSILVTCRQSKRTVADLFGLASDAFARPVLYDGMAFDISASVGAAPIDSAVTATEIQRRADVAMYAAKRHGGTACTVFDKSHDDAVRAEYELRKDLLKAIELKAIDVVYQPCFDSNGEPVAAEALARWQHPRLGAISPEVFIRLAEEAGVIRRLGQQVLEKACTDLVRLRCHGLMLRYIAVNVSPQELEEPDLVDGIRRVIEAKGLEPHDLELEVTESSVMSSRDQRSEEQLRTLSDAGFSIAIDDFGTGYSSLARLQTLPATKLKLDRSFISSLDTANGQMLVETMIGLGRRLGMVCVAEGVENREQLDWLLAHGCGLLQGFLLGKPMTFDALVSLPLRTLENEPVA
jgi:diguanylate cyclase (GGDEF)-like protein